TYTYPGRTLAIVLAGSGTGTVTSDVDGIQCPPDCAAGFGPNTVVTLGVSPAAGSAFGGFAGVGCGTSVVMSADRTCTALFMSGPPATFVDVPATHPLFAWIEALVGAGITTGCSPTGPQFCPDAGVTRAQMAVFLLRGVHGALYGPPAATGMFTDVPGTHPFGGWIEQLAREGVTTGCSPIGPQFCPDSGVTRAQMAVFLLRARHGATYDPPPPTGMFADVSTGHPFAKWIEQLAREGITGGCSPTTYCPDSAVTRGQMAVFLVRAFDL
ncbi:MAG: S-layer homology domain-containing protein, partial [Candidatus Rokuibacteriota bacterium]